MNKILKIIAIVAVIVGIAIVVIYLMGMWEPTKPIADAATGFGNQAVDYVKGNIPTVVAAGGTVTAIGGAALSKVNDANKKTTEVQVAANSRIDGLLSEKDKLTDTMESQKAQLEQVTTELSETKESAKNSFSVIEQQKTEIERLQAQLDYKKDVDALAKAYESNSRVEEAQTVTVP